ncbi:MAG: HEAT repeat domain-containing protein [Candidatus Heimdallarchaeota archaeon]
MKKNDSDLIVNTLIDIVKSNKSEEKRFWAIFALQESEIEKEDYSQIISEILLNDKSNRIRSTAAIILGEIMQKTLEMILSLEKALMNDTSEEVRIAAAFGLLNVEDKDIVLPKLISALKSDPSSKVRISIVKMFEQFRLKEIIEPLKEIIKDVKNPDHKFRYAFTIARLEEKEGYGIEIIKELKRKGQLSYHYEILYKGLCYELNIAEKVEEIKDQLFNSKTEINKLNKILDNISDGEEKEIIISIITKMNETTIIQEKTIASLQEVLINLTKAHQISIEKPAISINQIANLQDEKKESLWEKWGGEILGGLIGAVIGGAITAFIAWLL